MSRQDKTRNVILQLKAVKDERGISLQKILDLTLAAGGNVSMSTVRKVFSEGSENMNFRYEDTVQPIAMALLGTNEPPREVSGVVETEAEALRQLVQLKNSIIREQQEAVENSHQREQEIKADAQRKINYLKEQVSFKEDQMKAKDTQLAERRDFILRLEAEKKELRRTINVQAVLLVVAFILMLIGYSTDAILPLF